MTQYHQGPLISVLMEHVVAFFVADPEKDQDTDRHPHGQSRDADEGADLLPPDISPRESGVCLEHGQVPTDPERYGAACGLEDLHPVPYPRQEAVLLSHEVSGALLDVPCDGFGILGGEKQAE